jgi:CubicO group peptidase (beta-lactamase class C family)
MIDARCARDLGLDPQRFDRALALIKNWCDQGKIPSAGVAVGRRAHDPVIRLFGRQTLAADSPPVRDDAIFLIASITKPIVGAAALILVERGLLSLDDRVEEFVPAFGKKGKHAVTVRHLLTHTSGLPDMLPNNFELRAAHARLSDFVAGTCEHGLDFAPGRGVQYQSMGLLMLGEIIHHVSGKLCAQFLNDEVFEPLGMHDTALGATDDWFAGPDSKASRIATIRLPAEQQEAHDWNWNSVYWRKLGAPWGGLLTTPADLARFARMMLGHGALEGVRILSPAAICAATRNQLEAMRDIPADDRRTRPWGLGWRLNWPAHSANFGDFLGSKTYGHWGSTGTVMWIDPEQEAFVILLTTQPQEPHGNYLARASNALAAALVPAGE